jgi:hypothetical protein
MWWRSENKEGETVVLRNRKVNILEKCIESSCHTEFPFEICDHKHESS